MIPINDKEYILFRKTLQRKNFIIVKDLVLILLILFLLLWFPYFFQLNLILTVPISFLFGFFVHSLNLFVHEGAHYNLCKSRILNETIANSISIFFGESVANYRLHHFKHHKRLGFHDDPENSYFNVLNLRFILKLIFPIILLKKIFQNFLLKNIPKENTNSIQLISFLFTLHFYIFLYLEF